jgi:cytochrome c553
MNNKFIVMLTVALLMPLLAISVSAATASIEIKKGDPAVGETASAVCAGCHGSDGNSPTSAFPKLAGLGEKYLTEQLKLIQSGERVILEMTGILDGKSEQDLRDLAAYFNSKTMQLTGAKEMEVKVNAGIKVNGLELGERIFRAGNLETGVPACTGCHSPRAMGNAPAGYPRLSGQYPEYLVKQLRAYRAGDRTAGGNAKIMREIAKNLSDAEIDALANFIAGIN